VDCLVPVIKGGYKAERSRSIVGQRASGYLLGCGKVRRKQQRVPGLTGRVEISPHRLALLQVPEMCLLQAMGRSSDGRVRSLVPGGRRTAPVINERWVSVMRLRQRDLNVLR
jgi:hypothetical protein